MLAIRPQRSGGHCDRSAHGVISAANPTKKASPKNGMGMPSRLAFFVGFAALITPWALRSQWPPLRWGRIASTSVGVLFVVYLVTVELALLHKICLWCTGVHVISVLLFILVLIDEFRRIGQVD